MQIEKLMTSKEVAEILNTTEATLAVWRSLDRHGIPFVKFGGKILYEPLQIKKWISEHSINEL